MHLQLPAMTENLVKAMRAIVDLPADEEAKLCAIVVAKSVEKGDIFIREGTIPTKLAFVYRGLFRYYYVNQKGSEFTKGFFPENNFIASYTAMVRHRPSYYTVEALEDSEILTFDYHQWKILYDHHPCWSKVLLAILEKGYSKKETRERELLIFTAEERYRSFLEEYPHLENRIKQHMIASYLGITPVALSRIRNGMKRSASNQVSKIIRR
jgi:CRP-like cAMP-binding protein